MIAYMNYHTIIVSFCKSASKFLLQVTLWISFPLCCTGDCLYVAFQLVSVHFFSSNLCVKYVLLLRLIMIRELDFDCYTVNKF